MANIKGFKVFFTEFNKVTRDIDFVLVNGRELKWLGGALV